MVELAWTEKLGLEIKNHIKVSNSFSPELQYLNTSLLTNLFARAEDNLRFFDQVKIFELDRVFDKHEKSVYAVDHGKKKFLPKQDKHLAGVVAANLPAEIAFLQVKGLVEDLQKHWGIDWTWESVDLAHSNLAYQIKHQDVVLGHCGILKSNLLDSGAKQTQATWWEFNFSQLVKYINQNQFYQAISKFPSIDRDIALLVDKDIQWVDLEVEIYKVSSLIVAVDPFDIFTGKGVPAGKKSLAFHITLRSPEKTLESEDADLLVKEIVSILSKKFKAIHRK